MGFKKLVKKIARFVLTESSDKFTKVEVAQINYGGCLAGKKIVITGGGKGIGYHIAKRVMAEGAECVITGRNKDVLSRSASELGAKCHPIIFDVTNVHNCRQFLDQARESLGGELDFLVCNAGISLHEGHFSKVTVEGFDSQFNTNLKGTYFLSKAFLEMKLEEEHPFGELLLITSETADQCYDIPYGLTKASLNSLTGGLSRRVYQSGIRVNAIAPGVTVTDMTKDYASAQDGNMTSLHSASGRLFLPEEIAEVALFLLSDASKCISGEIIHCNAGNHLKVYWE